MTAEALKQAVTGQVTQAKNQHPAVDALAKAMDGIRAILPRHITAERMSKLAMGLLRTNKKIAAAAKRNPVSFVNAIMDASRLGLEPGFDAHLIPFDNKREKTTEFQMIPDYRGLMAIARRSGEITSISVHIVYEKDEFDLSLGITDTITHKPCLTGDRGEPKLVYGVAHFRDGSHHMEWMSVAQINKIRDNSKGYQTAKRFNNEDTPWVQHWDEMARKTLVRRMCKFLPRSIELVNAEHIVDAADRGATAHFDGEFVVIPDDDAGEADQTKAITDERATQIENTIPAGTVLTQKEAVAQRQASGDEPPPWQPSEAELAEIQARERAEAAAQQSSGGSLNPAAGSPAFAGRQAASNAQARQRRTTTPQGGMSFE